MVVTACNPEGKLGEEASNRKSTEELRAELEREGRTFGPMTGASPDGRHREPGFWVEADLAWGVELGCRFEQVAVFLVEGGAISVVPCDDPAGGVPVAAWAERWAGGAGEPGAGRIGASLLP